MNNSVLFAFLITFVGMRNVASIADQAAYYIRNFEDKLCLTGGPTIEKNMSLYERGIPIASNCSGKSNQQWILHANGTGDYTTKYELKSQNSTEINKLLNAKIRGEFIEYFPHPLNIYPVKGFGNYSRLYDTKMTKCYQGMGNGQEIKLEECKATVPSQLWHLELVSENLAPGTICSSFWSCNN